MRLKKGTKVEVLTKKEVPSGSWHCAEIIGCNGHSYTVRYDDDIGSFGVVERVSRKVIRPCPPSVDVLEDWIPGDVVEVFHNLSWKMATVLKVSGRSYILVRLLGSSIEFKANQVDVRARLCWQDGEWVVIGKAFGKHEDMRFRLPSSRKYNDPALKLDTSASQRIKVDHVSARNINSVLDSQDIPSRTLKRKPSLCYREFEAYAGRKQKVRLGEKHSTCYPFSVQQPQLPEKVDDVACSRELLAKKCMHSSFVNKMTGCSELILVSEKTYGVGCSRSTSLESNDDDSVSSSVGSCSVYGNLSHKLHHGLTAGPSDVNYNQCSDAESFCQLRSEEGTCPLPVKEKLPEEIHRLELHAYRCIIGALHASGPLSWEQELLLTNLRESLHISNDEHLMEIRNLVSSNACIPSS